MATTQEALYYPHLVKTLEERQNPNLTAVQKRKLTKRLKNQVRGMYGYEALEHLDDVLKMVKANKLTLTAELLTKLLAFIIHQKALLALDTESV
jgi:hypothetical protein